MKRITLLIMLAACTLGVSAQEMTSEEEAFIKKELNELKKDENIVCVEVTEYLADDSEKTITLSQQKSMQLLQAHVIEIFAKRFNMEKKDVQEIMDVIDDKCQNVEIRRGDLLRVFKYILLDAAKLSSGKVTQKEWDKYVGEAKKIGLTNTVAAVASAADNGKKPEVKETVDTTTVMSPVSVTPQSASTEATPVPVTPQPASTETAPVPVTPQPALTEATPVPVTPQPASTETAPVSVTPQSASTETTPVSVTPQPASTETAPVSVTPQSALTETTPVSVTPQPASTETAPVSVTPQSALTEATSVPVTPQPASTETAPVSITAPVVTEPATSEVTTSVTPTPQPVTPAQTVEVKVPEVCRTLLKQKDMTTLLKYLDTEKAYDKLIYGTERSMRRVADCYIVIVHKSTKQIATVLDKGKSDRLNFVTGKMDNFNNYRTGGNYQAVFVQPL